MPTQPNPTQPTTLRGAWARLEKQLKKKKKKISRSNVLDASHQTLTAALADITLSAVPDRLFQSLVLQGKKRRCGDGRALLFCNPFQVLATSVPVVGGKHAIFYFII